MNTEVLEICNLVKECGLFISNADRSSIQVDSKSGKANFVTEYDKKVQEKLREGLKKIIPDAMFMGEEGETEKYSEKGKYFIVDPIDGTTNFIKDYHMSCISVAYVIDGQAEYGVVYNPYLDEMYYAEKGKGSYCNGELIHVSNEPLENGLVLFGTSPYNETLHKKSFEMAYEFFRQALDIRRSGSAALDLCAVASGRAELYFELTLAPWDFAAGSLILLEAGGIITTIDGQPIGFDHNYSVLAKNK